ncbi:MAG: SprT-like domain-containing protein [Clostridia bacterium]
MSVFERRDNVITYTVNKAINKDMYITVQNGEVVVNAPWYFTSSKIQQIVQNKKKWILNKIREYENSLSDIQSVNIFGKRYDIHFKYENVKTPELNIEKNYKIKIIIPNKYKKIGNGPIIEMSIKKMYEQIANNEIESIMEKIRRMLGIAPEDYNIEEMNKTLGKCTNGKITINPELMQYKREIIEYVVAHEFCHLKYKTHGKKFYQIIEKNFPQYRNYEKAISEEFEY